MTKNMRMLLTAINVFITMNVFIATIILMMRNVNTDLADVDVLCTMDGETIVFDIFGKNHTASAQSQCRPCIMQTQWAHATGTIFACLYNSNTDTICDRTVDCFDWPCLESIVFYTIALFGILFVRCLPDKPSSNKLNYSEI